MLTNWAGYAACPMHMIYPATISSWLESILKQLTHYIMGKENAPKRVLSHPSAPLRKRDSISGDKCRVQQRLCVAILMEATWNFSPGECATPMVWVSYRMGA